MTWSPTPPAAPGRYWWRAPDKYKRHDSRQYGLILVQWTHYGDMAPSLRIVSICHFNSSFGGELSDRQGWSYGSSGSPTAFHEDYPGVEFWSESERGPGGFLPELKGKPDWTPPDPVVVKAKREKSMKESAKREKEEADERAEKISEAKKAGDILYECEQCEGLHTEDDLVQVRECPHCNDEKFNGTDEGQNCPSCNRRFTRNVTEHGCPECLEECEVLAESESREHYAGRRALEGLIEDGLVPKPKKKKRK